MWRNSNTTRSPPCRSMNGAKSIAATFPTWWQWRSPSCGLTACRHTRKAWSSGSRTASKLPIVGYFDFHWAEHNITTDLKTTERMPSEIKINHAKQVVALCHQQQRRGARDLRDTEKVSDLHGREHRRRLDVLRRCEMSGTDLRIPRSAAPRQAPRVRIELPISMSFRFSSGSAPRNRTILRARRILPA